MNLIFLSIMGGVAALSFSAFFNGERNMADCFYRRLYCVVCL